MKTYTDLEQSKELAKFLPLESADMCYSTWAIVSEDGEFIVSVNQQGETIEELQKEYGNQIIPCWSLAALLECLNKIKPQVYTPILFPSEGKWILQFAEYSHGNVCEVSCDNPVDACYEMILKLHEQNLL